MTAHSPKPSRAEMVNGVLSRHYEARRRQGAIASRLIIALVLVTVLAAAWIGFLAWLLLR